MEVWNGTLKCNMDIEQYLKILKKCRVLGLTDNTVVDALEDDLATGGLEDIGENEMRSLMNMPEHIKLTIEGSVYCENREDWNTMCIAIIVNGSTSWLLTADNIINMNYNHQVKRVEYAEVRDINHRLRVAGDATVDTALLKPGTIDIKELFKERVRLVDVINIESDLGVKIGIEYTTESKLNIDDDYSKIVNIVYKKVNEDVKEICSILNRLTTNGKTASYKQVIKNLQCSKIIQCDIRVTDTVLITSNITAGFITDKGSYSFIKVRKQSDDLLTNSAR